MSKKGNAKITLVGAGPGDPDLISVAGVKALKKADVVLYDALVNPEILEWASSAKKIFVGKRRGFKRFDQDQINHLIVMEALEHGHVVRLKGGDPFIFGRGSEEKEFAEALGIETHVIPGISSATSASVTQGISLTKRDVSQSFWVLTGTTKQGTISRDIALAARSSATLVILMGMSKLPEIVSTFELVGKLDTPVCIVQNAYMPQQKSVKGTLSEIVDKVALYGIANPAVIIIGEVVNHGDDKINELVTESKQHQLV